MQMGWDALVAITKISNRNFRHRNGLGKMDNVCAKNAKQNGLTMVSKNNADRVVSGTVKTSLIHRCGAKEIHLTKFVLIV